MHMLSGHAYSRAVRGHILVHVCLAKIILGKIDFTHSEKQLLNNMTQNEDSDYVLDAMKLSQYQSIKKNFKVN